MANEMHLHSFVANYLVQEVTNFMSSYPYSNPALLALMVSQLRKDADNH